MITRQEVFDKALAHLRAQGQSSMRDDGYCLYRSPEGLKCAIGALVPDEKYNEDFEGQAASAEAIYSLFDGNPQDAYFYGDLQGALHDDISKYSDFPQRLEIAAQQFAQNKGLEYTAC